MTASLRLLNFRFPSEFGFWVSDFGPSLGSFSFDNVDHAWLWLLLLAGGAWALLEIYRGIYRRTERRLTWVLLAMRAVGLLALVLALAKPAWIRRRTVVEPGHLAVILDNSRSMSLADSSGQPRYVRAKEAVGRIRRVMERRRAGAALVVDLFDINGDPVRGEPPSEPRVGRTDLRKALAQATARLRSQPLAGIVLVSDGMDNTGPQDRMAIEETTVPVYAVGFRELAEAGPFNLAVKRVRAPKRLIVNNTAKIDVVLEKTGGPAGDATVTIRRGRERFAEQTVALGPGSVQQTVSLNLTPTQAGSFVYTAAVAAPAGENRAVHHARPFPLEVDAEPIRVFYVEGFLRYEYKFLKSRLEDDPDVSLVSIVRRANPEQNGATAPGDLITAERLKNFDVVILGDMEGGYLAAAEYRALVPWINEGHSLLVLGGYRSFGPNGFRGTPLAEALPVVFGDSGPLQSEDPFVIELTELGKQHPAFEISGDRVKDAALWAASPQLLGSCLIQRVKPGADVLAVNPVFLAGGKPSPVAVVQRYGAGHTMVLAVDTTWRWTRLTRVLGQSDTLFARFWSQTVRWLAGRDTAEKRPPLAVSTDQPDYDIGKPVVVRIVRQLQADANPSRTAVTAEFASEDGRAVPVPMQANSSEPDVFTGTIYPSAGGRYDVTATLTSDGRLIANQAAEFLVHGPEIELADSRTNRGLLQSLAAASGGAYFDVDEAVPWADKIEPKERRLVLVDRTDYWNSPWLFLLFLAAVTAEWVIRRRNHLV